MTTVPVKGAVLQWARKFRGLEEGEAAERMGITVKDLLDYENERRQPSVTMFEAFASKYRIPQATLFGVTSPKEPSDPTDFRTIGGGQTKTHSFEFNVAFSNVRTLLFQFERLAADDDEFVAPVLPQLRIDDDAAEAGEHERRRLGVSVQDQFDWELRETFGRWRTCLERQGVLVFQGKFPIKDCRGFCLYESVNAPVVVVNKQETFEPAKAFTVWHEYCHLLLRRPGVSNQNLSEPTEAFCNRFAASFLMPATALRTLLPIWPNAPVEWSAADVARWAKKLKVSRRALAIRFEQLNLAPSGFAQKFAWGRAANPKNQSGSGDYIATRLSEIGFGFTGKIIDALDRRAIDTVQAVEALGIANDHLNKAREYVKRRELVALVASDG